MAADYLVPWLKASGQDGLRNSMQVIPGDGVTKTFSFNFAGGYISKDHIKAYVFNPDTGLTTEVTITADMWTGPSQLTFPTPTPVGQTLVIYRDTPKTQPLVSFANGAILNEPNLDEMAQQAVFATAEMTDRFDTVNDGSSLAIVNSATALNTANAAIAASAAATVVANAATGTANAASSKADAAVNTANTAQSTANDAKTTAQGIDGKAQSALDTAANAVTTANGAVATANGIDAKASSALTQAGQAVTTANSASSKADTAISTANSVSGTANDAKTVAAAAQSTANAASAAVATAVQKSGDTMTGWLTLQQTSGAYSAHLYFDAAGYKPFMRANNASGLGGSVEIVNAANSFVNFSLYDNGNFMFRGTGSVGGNLTVAGETYAKQRIYLWRDGTYGEMAIRSADGTCMYLRGRSGGGGVEFINNAYNRISLSIDDAGALAFGDGGRVNSDGNVRMNWKNQYLSEYCAWNESDHTNLWNGKADRNANCNYNSGLIELGACNVGGTNTSDCGNPWVLIGLRTQYGTNNVWPRAVYLRNN
ncbi:phage tail fiber domain-containing protein [Paraburkholderia youngii]|uniref:Bacteriophage T7 tail fibre protein-like N-terminal domain-containing protein n=1 Tax=Paraburkholderia youngii TaxID=2782701 RepID=A0A7Y6MWK9_9BURK|nr:phage tail fiber protein [Paraburkholderia youngii]NUX98786.1 hypothetical protein [Paraburkholderia youngii]